MNDAPFVFISYARTDGTVICQQIKEQFEKAGINVWIDEQLENGKPFPREIEIAIRKCKMMVLVITPKACLPSSYVHTEFQTAKAEQKPIKPIFCMSPQSVVIPVEWAILDGIDYINNPEELNALIKNTNDWFEGKISAETIIKGHIESSYLFLDKGKRLYKLGRFREASAAFRKAINAYNQALTFDEASGDVWFNKGVALADNESYQEAIEAFEQAIEKNPDDDEAWYNKGAVLEALHRYEEALFSIKQSIRLNPSQSLTVKRKLAQLENTVSKIKELEIRETQTTEKKHWLGWLRKK